MPHLLSSLVPLLAASSLQTTDPFPPAEPESVGLAAESLAALSKFVAEQVRADEYVGAELLIIKDGKTVLYEAYGWRDRENEVPLEPNALFNVRSMTKPLTGTAAQQLIEEGRLALDDTAASLMPAFDHGEAAGITVANLLEHRAGLKLSSLIEFPMTDFANLRALADRIGAVGPRTRPARCSATATTARRYWAPASRSPRDQGLAAFPDRARARAARDGGLDVRRDRRGPARTHLPELHGRSGLVGPAVESGRRAALPVPVGVSGPLLHGARLRSLPLGLDEPWSLRRRAPRVVEDRAARAAAGLGRDRHRDRHAGHRRPLRADVGPVRRPDAATHEAAGRVRTQRLGRYVRAGVARPRPDGPVLSRSRAGAWRCWTSSASCTGTCSRPGSSALRADAGSARGAVRFLLVGGRRHVSLALGRERSTRRRAARDGAPEDALPSSRAPVVRPRADDHVPGGARRDRARRPASTSRSRASPATGRASSRVRTCRRSRRSWPRPACRSDRRASPSSAACCSRAR